MTFRADLHVHTTCSDGSLAPKELLNAAKNSGLGGVCITDHDTLDAYENLVPDGIQVGVGVEFSCFLKDEAIHVLGYDVDLDSPEIKELCKRHKKRREHRNAKILEKLSLMGMPITECELNEVAHGKVIGRPHIATIMVNKGYVLSFQEAFSKYLAEGKSGYFAGDTITIEETISIIHKAHGKAVLAHPHLISSKKKALKILQMGFDGVEGYYARFLLDQNTPWLKFAGEHGLMVSGGSDFHGDLKPYNILGSSWVNEETFDKIFQKKLN